MIELSRDGDVFTLTMDAGENRWNTTFVRALTKVLDEVESSTGAAALVTTSANQKFYSNGLDLDWVRDPSAHPAGGDRTPFSDEFMKLMSRLITFPIPTLAAKRMTVDGSQCWYGKRDQTRHEFHKLVCERGAIAAGWRR